MDEHLTLHELQRLEAKRKLRAIPPEVLETAWVRDAQIEAVIDAVLVVTLGGDAKAIVHARHVGEWCARIAGNLSSGPDPVLARRVGVLADADPAALEQVAELRHLAPYVRNFQQSSMANSEMFRTMTAILAVADEFAARMADATDPRSVGAVLRAMVSGATERRREAMAALAKAVSTPHVLALEPRRKSYVAIERK
jgi:hypothetical protein